MSVTPVRPDSLDIPKPIEIGKSILSFDELMAKNIPERRLLLPWLPEGGLCMISALRGLGKTFFGLSLAVNTSFGSKFMVWDTKQTGVLYVDGEMPLGQLRDRIRHIAGSEMPEGMFSILSHESFYDDFERDLSITAFDVQDQILKHLDNNRNLRVLIIDNLSSLTKIREDKSDDWRSEVLPFLIACRRRGVAVVMIHHTGKSGDQRGTGAREDHLDTSIRLSRTEDYSPESGCEFKVEFTKSRGCYGDDVCSFIASLTPGEDGFLTWATQTLEESDEDRLIELIRSSSVEGISSIEAEKELGVSRHVIRRLKTRLIAGGVIQDRPGHKSPMIIAENWSGK